MGHFHLGMLLSGAERSWRRLLVNPIILSLCAALLVMLLELQLPRWLANTDQPAGRAVDSG